MNILFDTNVVLDALLDREPWADAAVSLFDRVESGAVTGLLGATTVTTIHYIARRNVNEAMAAGMITDLLQLFEIAPVNRAVLEGALALGFDDFEDAVLHEAGRLAGAESIVTRDRPDFSAATLRVYDPEGNETGVLVSHGFTGTTQSVRPLGEALAAEGFTVAGPRLAGHGTSMEDHARSGATDWIHSIEEDLAWLETRCERVYFAGLSMGGMFSLYFAGMRPDLIRGVIPINACVYLGNPDLARITFLDDAPATVPGVGSDIKMEGGEELVYPEVPVPPVKEFMAIMRVTDDLLPAIQCPALILQSLEDHVVPPDNGPHILDRLGSEKKELVRLENSYHVATLDNDAPLIAERTIEFIRRN